MTDLAHSKTQLDPAHAATVAADLALGATQAADGFADAPADREQSLRTTFLGRTTVLPQVETVGASVSLRPRSFARYRIEALLGSGGMGDVTLGHDDDIHRRVALKHLRAQAPELVARFVEEVRIVGALEHPNIVPIHDVGVDQEGKLYFVMRHIEGETLEALIDRLRNGDPDARQTYTFERRVELFIGVLRALQYAHARGIVHRDIKPANVMVGRYGEVVLMDWGIAKQTGKQTDKQALASPPEGASNAAPRRPNFETQVGALLGTPAYMSPEQARGQHDTLDHRSDLYSACVLFHELMTLRYYLGDRATVAEMLAAVVGEEPPVGDLNFSWHPAQKATPVEYLYIVAKGLKKDPAQRFQSAEELIVRLERTLAGKVVVQCHITMTKRMFRELGRLVDRAPHLAFGLFVLLAASLLTSLVLVLRAVTG